MKNKTFCWPARRRLSWQSHPLRKIGWEWIWRRTASFPSSNELPTRQALPSRILKDCFPSKILQPLGTVLQYIRAPYRSDAACQLWWSNCGKKCTNRSLIWMSLSRQWICLPSSPCLPVGPVLVYDLEYDLRKCRVRWEPVYINIKNT
jgi:hypothetical protein